MNKLFNILLLAFVLTNVNSFLVKSQEIESEAMDNITQINTKKEISDEQINQTIEIVIAEIKELEEEEGDAIMIYPEYPAALPSPPSTGTGTSVPPGGNYDCQIYIDMLKNMLISDHQIEMIKKGCPYQICNYKSAMYFQGMVQKLENLKESRK